jgi:hypothetical protein
MPKRSSKKAKKKTADINLIESSIVEQTTAAELFDSEIVKKAIEEGKDPLAVILGKRGGLKGGKARAEQLSAKRRKKIAQDAAKARWKKD